MFNFSLPQISQYLSSPIFSAFLSVLKIIFLVLSFIFFGYIIFALIRTTWLKRLFIWDWQEFFTYKPYGVRRLVKQWQKVMARLDAGIESEYKLSVIEADSILDDILKRMGFGGETLGERLEKLTAATLPNLNDILEAHKTRNNIVHDPDYKLSLDEAKKTLAVYETALTDLQAL